METNGDLKFDGAHETTLWNTHGSTRSDTPNLKQRIFHDAISQELRKRHLSSKARAIQFQKSLESFSAFQDSPDGLPCPIPSDVGPGFNRLDTEPPSYLLGGESNSMAKCSNETLHERQNEHKDERDEDIPQESRIAAASASILRSEYAQRDQSFGEAILRRKTWRSSLRSERSSQATLINSPITTFNLRERQSQVMDPALRSSTLPASRGDIRNKVTTERAQGDLQSIFAPPDVSSSSVRDDGIINEGSKEHANGQADALPEKVASTSTYFEPAPIHSQIENIPVARSTLLPGLGNSAILYENPAHCEIPWWSISAEETAIKKALENERMPPVATSLGSRSQAARRLPKNAITCEQLERRMKMSLATCSRPAIPQQKFAKDRRTDEGDRKLSRISQPSIVTRDMRTRAISQLSKLPRNVRTRILLFTFGVDPSSQASRRETLRDSSQPSAFLESANSTQLDFLKLTASEKKAFYSSMSMNKIGTGLRRSGQNLSEGKSSDKRNRTTITLPQILERWCCSSRSEEVPKTRCIDIILWAGSDFTVSPAGRVIYDTAVKARKDEPQSLDEIAANIEQKRAKLNQLCSSWVVAMRRLPRWVAEVRVAAVVPRWVDEHELDVHLARIKSYALFRTEWEVTWRQELRREGS